MPPISKEVGRLPILQSPPRPTALARRHPRLRVPKRVRVALSSQMLHHHLPLLPVAAAPAPVLDALPARLWSFDAYQEVPAHWIIGLVALSHYDLGLAMA